ncbi:DUF1097 domain-containing protein [Halobaculum sp. MBLA0147]|uniref:DUF1097 domain-containing protein n=1 Tax=Halobaculum sp. MBLA0147 TaxID=3079934 RepID=UPI0035233A4B
MIGRRVVASELDETLALAIVFGVASVPWTYVFVAVLEIPLWPSFVASASFYAVDADGLTRLQRGLLSNLAGICYAALTLVIVDGLFGGGHVALSLVVGAFMLLASLHAAVPVLSFTPGGFFGYATLFSVHAAGASVGGLGGLPGETVATVLSMSLGATIGFVTRVGSTRLDHTHTGRSE